MMSPHLPYQLKHIKTKTLLALRPLQYAPLEYLPTATYSAQRGPTMRPSQSTKPQATPIAHLRSSETIHLNASAL